MEQVAAPTRIYAGADWIKDVLDHHQPVVAMSPLGIAVADLLGDLFAGIYHLNITSLRKVDWSNERWIVFHLDRHLATFDSDDLTRLVVLCHDRCLRCDLTGKGPRIIEMQFHQRQGREGPMWARHPTLEQAAANIRAGYAAPEVANG